MAKAVRDAFDKGLLPADCYDFGPFLDDLRATQAAGSAPASRRYHLVTELPDFRAGIVLRSVFRGPEARDGPDAFAFCWTEALRTPAGKVGRDQPCPCGSGRKSQKCDLQ